MSMKTHIMAKTVCWSLWNGMNIIRILVEFIPKSIVSYFSMDGGELFQRIQERQGFTERGIYMLH